MQALRAWVKRASPLEAFYPLCTPLGRFEGLGEVPPVRFDHTVLKPHNIADIHALAVVIELADIDLSAVNMMPPRQGMHIPQLGYL
jgi:hypothetical protein